MSNKTLTLSIVIPVFNEQDHLQACLESIAKQSIMPDEVIVVDNNSTDQTVEIAGSYGFVKLLCEPNQHQSFAQKTGFNAATSDIIGRLDADSVLPANWVKNTKQYFSSHPGVVGITGGTVPYDVSSAKIGTAVFKFYINLASKIGGLRMLWGANCAVRRSAWAKISNNVKTRGDIWEDYDLSFCLASQGELKLVDNIDVDSSFRAVHQSLTSQTRYQFRAVRTFYFRRNLLTTTIFFLAWSSLFLLFVPAMLDKYVLRPLVEIFSAQKRSSKAPEVVRLEAE